MDPSAQTIDTLFAVTEIPLSLKIAYAVFVVILIPIYWRYWGPANFLWFSDQALFLTGLALWLESPLLVGMQTLSVGFLEVVWNVDFATRLLTGYQPVGLTEYMFKPDRPLLVRALSLFHVPLPILLFWLVYRWGYDPRSLWVQTLVAWGTLLFCRFFTKPSENINWVFTPAKRRPTWLESRAYFAVLMVGLPLLVYLPMHLVLMAIVPAHVTPANTPSPSPPPLAVAFASPPPPLAPTCPTAP